MKAVVTQEKSRPYTALKGVIIYDDSRLAARATALLERAAVGVDEHMKWDIKPWRFDVLKRPALAAIAVAVAADADLIVLAMNRTDPAPGELMNWLKRWAERRLTEDAAILALQGSENAAPTSFGNELKWFAQSQGLSLLERHGARNEVHPATFATGQHQAQAVVI